MRATVLRMVTVTCEEAVGESRWGEPFGRAVEESRYGEPLGIAASESATVLRKSAESR